MEHGGRSRHLVPTAARLQRRPRLHWFLQRLLRRGFLRGAWGSGRAARRDQGAITLWVAVTFAAILLVAGLVADGGARIRAGERADIVAGEAARAGSYANGADAFSRTAAATAAARGILSRSGLAGSVAIISPGRITVVASASATGPISGMTYTVSRSATAQLLLGVGTGETP